MRFWTGVANGTMSVHHSGAIFSPCCRSCSDGVIGLSPAGLALEQATSISGNTMLASKDLDILLRLVDLPYSSSAFEHETSNRCI